MRAVSNYRKSVTASQPLKARRSSSGGVYHYRINTVDAAAFIREKESGCVRVRESAYYSDAEVTAIVSIPDAIYAAGENTLIMGCGEITPVDGVFAAGESKSAMNIGAAASAGHNARAYAASIMKTSGRASIDEHQPTVINAEAHGSFGMEIEVTFENQKRLKGNLYMILRLPGNGGEDRLRTLGDMDGHTLGEFDAMTLNDVDWIRGSSGDNPPDPIIRR